MLDLAFQYDCIKKEWVRCASRNYAHEEIEKLPYALIVQYENEDNNNRLVIYPQKYVFCPNHRRTEKITEIRRNYVVSADGCVFEGLISCCVLHLNRVGFRPPTEYVPFRWRIFQSSPSGPINIAGDVAEVHYDRSAVLLQWLNCGISIHPAKPVFLTTIIRDRGQEEWTKGTNVEIPDIVVDAAMDALRESTRIIFGIKPSMLSQMKGHAKLLAYAERPFDINIVFLKPVLEGLTCRKFDEVFPYDCKDNYTKVCQLLDIHPPKSLRKAYSYNPYAIVWYMIFKHWWIKDINLMQRFFYLDDCVAGFPLKESFISNDQSKHVGFGWDYWRDWDAMSHYCVWRISQEGEKKFLHWLYQVSSTDTLQSWQWDTINAFYHNESSLSDGIKQLLLRDGLTQYVHDQISWEVTANSKGLADVQISYEPSILAYQCIINGYEFRVVQDTHTLRHVGLLLQNCVATYRELVIDHRSIIVVVRHEDKYVACIEIQPKRGIVQALGMKNHRLDGEVLQVCRYWVKLEKLHVDTNHLNFSDSSQELFDLETATVETGPYQKKVEDTDATELTALDEDNIQSGYYRKIGIELLRGPKQIISAPPWMQFQDEQAYLMYVFPQGQRIYDAAFNGNIEAQIVLGMMYCCGSVFHRDTEKTLTWFSKAAQNDDKRAQEEMEKLTKHIGDEITEKDIETLWGLSRVRHLIQMEKYSA